MERAKLSNDELTSLILYAIKRNGIGLNNIDYDTINRVIKNYHELCN